MDLYLARARSAFLVAAAAERGLDQDVLKRDLGRVLLACERLADEAVAAAQALKDEPEPMTPEEWPRPWRCCAPPHLAEWITADFVEMGMVGEQANCLTGYLAAVSRKLERRWR